MAENYFWLGASADADPALVASDQAASRLAPAGVDPLRGDGLFYDSCGFAITIGGERYGPVSPLRAAIAAAKAELLSIALERVERPLDRAYDILDDVHP